MLCCYLNRVTDYNGLSFPFSSSVHFIHRLRSSLIDDAFSLSLELFWCTDENSHMEKSDSSSPPLCFPLSLSALLTPSSLHLLTPFPHPTAATSKLCLPPLCSSNNSLLLWPWVNHQCRTCTHKSLERLGPMCKLL